MGLSGRRLSAVASALVLSALPAGSAGGASCPCWRPAGRGMPPAVYVLTVAADQRQPGTLYAGTISNGIQKSVDGGATWRATAGSFPLLGEGVTERPAAIVSLALDPSRPGTLYAGTSSGGVLKTSDGGASWSRIDRGLVGLTRRSSLGPPVYPPVAALALDPSRPRTLYASVLGAGVFKTVDGGARWRPARAGLANLNVEALVLDAAHPNVLYAGTNGDGVFASVDGGRMWRATGLAGEYVEALAIASGQPRTIYAGTLAGGVFKTEEGGGRWRAVNAGLGNRYVRALELDPRRPGTVYAGTLGGVFETVDGGRRWVGLNHGLRNRLVQTLELDPLASGGLFAGTLGSGVFVLRR